MKLIKQANALSIQILHKDWFIMGKKAGWLQKQAAQANDVKSALSVYNQVLDESGDPVEAKNKLVDALAQIFPPDETIDPKVILYLHGRLEDMGLNPVEVFNEISKRYRKMGYKGEKQDLEMAGVPAGFEQGVPQLPEEEAISTKDDEDKWIVKTPPEFGTKNWKLPIEKGDKPNDPVAIDFMDKVDQKGFIDKLKVAIDAILDRLSAGEIDKDEAKQLINQKNEQLNELSFAFASSKNHIVIASGKKRLLTMSFVQWREMGRKAGWLKPVK